MDKRIKSLDKMRNMGRKRGAKGSFDLNYIKSLQFYKDLGKRAMKVLSDSNYMDICKSTEAEKSFCHHDYTYHNIIISDDSVNVIDFDYCKREVRAYDIANFMTKVLKRVDWDIEYAKIIIDNYNKVDLLREEEYKVIFAFLLFPQRFWRLSNRYYYNEVNWAQNTFGNKLENLISEQEIYMNFIEEFKELYNQIE